MKHIDTSNKKGADLSEMKGKLKANINKMLELIRLEFVIVDILHGEIALGLLTSKRLDIFPVMAALKIANRFEQQTNTNKSTNIEQSVQTNSTTSLLNAVSNVSAIQVHQNKINSSKQGQNNKQNAKPCFFQDLFPSTQASSVV